MRKKKGAKKQKLDVSCDSSLTTPLVSTALQQRTGTLRVVFGTSTTMSEFVASEETIPTPTRDENRTDIFSSTSTRVTCCKYYEKFARLWSQHMRARIHTQELQDGLSPTAKRETYYHPLNSSSPRHRIAKTFVHHFWGI